MSFTKLKRRIKKNEGYSKKPYKDQLGFYTIGYGHLIKKNESKYYKSVFNKQYYNELFEKDFNNAFRHYKNKFYLKSHKKNEKELLIEMLFQLGPNGVSKFKKMLFYLNRRQKNMVCLEMLDSLWYRQTPKRVENLIKYYKNR